MKKALILIAVISLISIWPFFKKGYFESHDGEWMVIRFTAFHQTLVSGQFPVRFVDRLNNNYGYPVMNFLYPLPFYLAELPKIIGFGFVDSIKIIFVVSTIASSILMFVALKQKFKMAASFAGALIYLFTPYRFIDLYVRGSYGEAVAFAIMPFCLLSIFKIQSSQKIYLPILAISITLLITSHNVIALLFLPLLFLIALIIDRKNIKYTLLSFCLGIFIAAFFWIPAFFDLKYVKLSQIKVSEITDHLVSPQRLIIPSLGYGPNPNGTNPLPVQLGITSVLVVLASIFLVVKSKKKDKLIIFLISTFIIIALLLTNLTKLFWQNIPLVDIIQFPWRMLASEVFVVSIITAFVVDRSHHKIATAFVVAILSIITTLPYTKPAAFTNHPDDYYSTNEATTTVRDEYMPIWVNDKIPERAKSKIEMEGSAKIINSKILPANYTAQLSLEKPARLQVNSIFFPGWQAKLDGREIPIEISEPHGLMIFSLPKGNHEVIIKYSKTPIHLLSEVISLIALGVTGLFLFYYGRKRETDNLKFKIFFITMEKQNSK